MSLQYFEEQNIFLYFISIFVFKNIVCDVGLKNMLEHWVKFEWLRKSNFKKKKKIETK